MRILVLGGTAWLGGEIVGTAAARGHDVTCLARGESGDPPPGVRWVAADRREHAAYDDVREQRWDEVVDVTRQPGQARSALDALADQAAHWTYVSSVSAYAANDVPGADESAPLMEPFAGDEADAESYGQAKVACEQAVTEAAGGRAILARAGLIGGPGDRSDRFGYWPARFAWAAEHPDDAGGAVLVPDAGGQPTQTIDVRDLAQWLVRCAEERVIGAFNAVGEQIALAEVLEVARSVAGHTGPLVTADPDWLLGQGVGFWMGPESLPLWAPGADFAGLASRSDAAALAAGLRRRPLRDLVTDTLAWERGRGLDRERRAGLSRPKERDVLQALASAL